MHKKIKIRVACGAIEVGGPFGMTSWQPIYKDIEVEVDGDPNHAQDQGTPQSNNLRGAKNSNRTIR
ncbi:MAG: hypothetical protein V4673_08990 [Pseudomonadota bacterium]